MGNPISRPGNTPVNQPTTNTPSRADADAPAKFGDAVAKEQTSAGPQKPAQNASPFIFSIPLLDAFKQPVPIPRYTGSDVPKSPIQTEKPADDYKQPTPKLEKKELKGPDGIKHPEPLAQDQGVQIISVERKHDKLK